MYRPMAFRHIVEAGQNLKIIPVPKRYAYIWNIKITVQPDVYNTLVGVAELTA